MAEFRSFCGILGKVFMMFVILLMAASIYRPMPPRVWDMQLNISIHDRVLVSIIEPLTRILYLYPSQLCPTPLCKLHYTRRVISALSQIAAPFSYDDAHMVRETTYWDGVKVRIYYPRDVSTAESDGVLLFMHGGGFGMGSTEMYESVTRTLAAQLSIRLVVSIDYRLAPETAFPGGLEDCERILEYVIANGPAQFGIDPRKIIVAGDSAGGNLAAVIAQRRRRRGAILLYPLLQLSDMQSPSYRNTSRELDGLVYIDAITVATYYLWYAGVDVNKHPEYAEAVTRNGHLSEEARNISERYMNYSLLPDSLRHTTDTSDNSHSETLDDLADYLTPFLTNPDFAPVMEPDLSGLPATFICTCEYDVLRDEGAIYAQRLKHAGVPTQWIDLPLSFHGALNLHNQFYIAIEAMKHVKDWTMNLLNGADFSKHQQISNENTLY